MAQEDQTRVSLTIRERLSLFTKKTFFVMLYAAGCAFNFGYDVGNFGGVQGMQSECQPPFEH